MPLSQSRRAALALACAAALGVASSPLFAQSTGPKPLTKVSFRLDWKPGGQHAPFYLGWSAASTPPKAST